MEGHFSVIRDENGDNCKMGTKITGKASRQLYSALRHEGSFYDASNLVEIGDSTVSGTRAVTKYGKDATKAVNEWKALRGVHPPDQPPLRFGEGDIHKSELLRFLGSKMSAPRLDSTSYLETRKADGKQINAGMAATEFAQ